MTGSLELSQFNPRSEAVVAQTHVARARFPLIDFHYHLNAEELATDYPALRQLLADMDELNVRCIVNLSGGYGEALRRSINLLDRGYPGRFVSFANLDWRYALSDGWLAAQLKQFEQAVHTGARGLKIFKELGLRYYDPDRRLIMPDDERLAPIWELAGRLNVPVLIHTADPVAFFRPLDGENERYEELINHPDWHFYGEQFPSFAELIESLISLVSRHPNTQFVAAHVGCYAENLSFVSDMLERLPNLCVDIAARLPELGRVPYSANAFFTRHADRILFGTDNDTPAGYRTFFRFLETSDEYFSYAPNRPHGDNGRWNIYGITLEDDILRRVYWANAARILRLDP